VSVIQHKAGENMLLDIPSLSFSFCYVCLCVCMSRAGAARNWGGKRERKRAKREERQSACESACACRMVSNMPQSSRDEEVSGTKT